MHNRSMQGTIIAVALFSALGLKSSRPAIRLLPLLLSLFLCLSACAPNTGLFAGGDWQSGGLQHQHIRILAVDPNNVQLIYAADAQDGIFVSADAGEHWSQSSTGLPLSTAIYALSFDASGKKLYAATNAGVFVSSNSAHLWSAIGKGTAANSLPADNYTALAFDPNAVHTIYVGSARHGVLKSVDDGRTWSEASNGLPPNTTIQGLTLDSNHHQLWSATNAGIYLSRNGATSWQALNDGLPTSIIINAVLPASISGGQAGLVYAGTNHGFFISQDSGAHWAMSKVSLAGVNINAILVDFRNPSTVYIATNVGVFRSDDGGESWAGVAPGLPRGQPVYDLAIGGTDNSQLYAAANDVYLFPGTSGGFSLGRIISIALILLMFYLLYRLVFRRNSRSRERLKPEHISEPPSQDIPL